MPVASAPVSRLDLIEVDKLEAAQVAALLTDLAALETRCAARLAALAAQEQPRGPDGDHLLSIDEACLLLGVGRDFLRRRPDLPFIVKIGGAVRYSHRRLQQFI